MATQGGGGGAGGDQAGAGLCLADFFPAAAASQLEGLPPLSPRLTHCLLCGPERSGKTTLLFQLAHAMARRGASVLIMGSRERLEQAPPVVAPEMPLSDPEWDQIHIKYVAHAGALLQYASLLHLAPAPPTVIMVDGLEGLIATGGVTSDEGKAWSKEASLCRVLAVLCDSMDFVAKKFGQPTLLVVAETTPGAAEPPRGLHLLQRWLPLVVGTRPAGEDRFRLSALGPMQGGAHAPLPVGSRAEYTLGHRGAHLEGVLPPEEAQHQEM